MLGIGFVIIQQLFYTLSQSVILSHKPYQLFVQDCLKWFPEFPMYFIFWQGNFLEKNNN